jgi:hypothetical protein
LNNFGGGKQKNKKTKKKNWGGIFIFWCRADFLSNLDIKIISPRFWSSLRKDLRHQTISQNSLVKEGGRWQNMAVLAQFGSVRLLIDWSRVRSPRVVDFFGPTVGPAFTSTQK